MKVGAMSKKKRFILIVLFVLICTIIVFGWPYFRILSGFIPRGRVVGQVVNISEIPNYRVGLTYKVAGPILYVLLSDDTDQKTIVISKKTTRFDKLGIDPSFYPLYQESLDQAWQLASGITSGAFKEFKELSREVIAAQGYQFPVLRGTYTEDGQTKICCLSILEAIRGNESLRFQIYWMSENSDFTTVELEQVLNALNIN